MMFMTAKAFCDKTGFPVRTFNRYLREGFIPCHRVGRKYIIDEEKALLRLSEIAEEAVSVIVPCKREKPGKRRGRNAVVSFEERVRALRADG